MKFLVDAHLPPRLCALLKLPDQTASKDRFINQVSLAEERFVISKDSDFFGRDSEMMPR